MKKEEPILVAIQCLVYNHEPYLRDCFEGFVMQKTNFRFVVIVHDDVSKDKSTDIIREYAEKYPDIFIPIYETENQYSKHDGSLKCIMNDAIDATGAKYVAYCEGDDYWIDPYKLQKQVDILEVDDSLMACCTNVCVVDNKSVVLEEIRSSAVVPNNKTGKYTIRDFFKNKHQYPTLTVVYRNTHTKEIASMVQHMENPFLGDWTLWIAFHVFGDFYYLNEVTGAYRINPTSVTHTVNRVARAKASRKICNQVADILPEEFADIAANLRDTGWVWHDLVYAYKAEKKYMRMIGAICMCMIKCPHALWNDVKRHLTKKG